MNYTATGITISIDSAGGNKTINANGGSLTLDNDPGNEDPVKTANEPVNVTINVSSGAQINFASTEHLQALNVADGAVATMPADGTRVMVTKALSITGSGKLELADNAMIVDYTGASPVSTIQSLLTSGHNGGAWNGGGINSSTAAVVPNRALGFAEATDVGSPSTFAGQSIDNTSVLVRYTIVGDADLNRSVNVNDLGILASNWQLSSKRWSQGNFDYSPDGLVNVNDLGMLASNWQTVLAAPSAPARPAPKRHAASRIAVDLLGSDALRSTPA
jgi:hypothetical protein